MELPFTVEQFLDVFRRYNEAVWPAQWILTALGLSAVLFALRGFPRDGRLVSGALAVLWLWMGVVYHLLFFREINPLATVFGAMFLVQAGLFAWLGVWRGRLRFAMRVDVPGVTGAFLVGLALLLYPLASHALGHRFPASPTFGLPCPTTILTFAVLTWAAPRAPRALLIVPVIWALVGTSAALQLGMHEDLSLPLAALLGTLAPAAGRMLRHRRELRTERAWPGASTH